MCVLGNFFQGKYLFKKNMIRPFIYFFGLLGLLLLVTLRIFLVNPSGLAQVHFLLGDFLKNVLITHMGLCNEN